MSIEVHMLQRPRLAEAVVLEPTDSTLSSGEVALTNITRILVEQAHRLDGAELMVLSEVLSAYAQEVSGQEARARKILKRRSDQE